jgi:putative hemolysin
MVSKENSGIIMTIELLIIFFIIFLWINSGLEALSQLTRGRVRKLENENSNLAQKAERWFDGKTAYQIVFKIILFFNIAVIASLLFEIFHNTTFYRYFSNSKETSIFWYIIPHIVIAAVVTVLLIVLAETLARFFVAKYDIYILKITMPLIKLLHYTLLYPFVLFINAVKHKVQHSQSTEEDDITTTEDEIMSLIENDSSSGLDDNSLEEDERQMIKGIFELNNTDVKEIMTPRVDVIAIPSTASIDAAIKLFIESGHSRIPVYFKTIDEIAGIILVKDFLIQEECIGKTLSELSHKPIFVPETKQIGELLDDLKGSHNHFSVIIDEYGGTAGIVTLEDILEEIVGEIHDEHETIEESAPHFADDGSVIMDARTMIDEVNEILNLKLPEDEDVDTIGGFLCSRLGKIPEPGAETTIDNSLNIKVLEADKRRVMTLKLKVISSSE